MHSEISESTDGRSKTCFSYDQNILKLLISVIYDLWKEIGRNSHAEKIWWINWLNMLKIGESFLPNDTSSVIKSNTSKYYKSKIHYDFKYWFMQIIRLNLTLL